LPIANRGGLLHYAFCAKCAEKPHGDGLYTPAAKCVYSINTHLRIPHLFGIQEIGNFAWKMRTYPEAKDFPWIEEEMEISFICK
jgi:hypothetical protein